MNPWSTGPARMILVMALLSLPVSASGEDATSREQLAAELGVRLEQRFERARSGEIQKIAYGAIPTPEQVHFMALRLRLWGENWVQFVSRTAGLSDVQTAALRASSGEVISLELGEYARRPHSWPLVRVNPPTEDFPVLLMTEENNGNLVRKKLKIFTRNGALSVSQAAAVNLAFSQAADFEQAAFRDYLIAVLDDELYFTDQQRAYARDHLCLEEGLMCEWLFDSPLSQITGRYKDIPIHVLESVELSASLLPVQAATLELLRHGGGIYRLGVSFSTPHVEWVRQLDESAAKLRDEILLQAELKLHYYSNELGFPEEAISRLRAAGELTAPLVAEEWRADTFKFLDEEEDSHKQQQGFTSIGLSGIVTRLESRKTWDSQFPPALRKLRRWDAQRRTAAIRWAMSRVTVALLDRELQFNSAQREMLIPVVENSLPAGAESSPRGYVAGLSCLAYTLINIPRETVQQVLSPEQISQWEILRKYYELNSPGRVQFVRLHGNLNTLNFDRE